MKADVFISHAGKDSRIATKIASALKARGIDVWIDFEPLMLMKTRSEDIENALSSCRVLISLISTATSSSSFLAGGEIAVYQMPRKETDPIIIPVVIEPCHIPAPFDNYQLFYMYESTFDRQIDTLTETLKRILSKKSVFINYRRMDSSRRAKQLYKYLTSTFGEEKVFMDIDNIKGGEDFVSRIEATLANCDILIALVGNQWLTLTDADGRRRLDNPNDFVRIEIVSALDRNIPVIPVLVNGAVMPIESALPVGLKQFAHLNALRIDDKYPKRDIERLVKHLQKNKSYT